MTEPLRDYQVEDLAFYIAERKSMNLSDPGTGKTPSVCVNQYRRAQEGIKTAWVMPKKLLRKNRDELLRFAPFGPKDVAIVDNQAKVDRVKDAAVWLMTPERFRRSWAEMPAQACDVDEFHVCFGPGGLNAIGGIDIPKRTEAFYEMMKRAQECVLMTGTLIHGRLDSAFPAIQAIEPRYYMGYRSFLTNHAYLDAYGRPNGWYNQDRIAAILARHGIRRTFESVYGPEAKVFLPETTEMSPKQRAYYDDFLKTLTVDLGEAILDGTAPPQTLLVGRKIMEIPFALRDPRGDDLPRIDLLDGALTGKEELMDLHFADHARSGKPFVVFAFFVRQQERLAELARKHGLKVEIINGSTSIAQGDRIDKAFQRGELDGVIASQKSAAFGYNWQDWGFDGDEVEDFYFVSFDYLDTNFLQAYRRGIRRQRKTPLRIWILKYEGSMDDRVFDIIERKSEDASSVDPTREVYRLNNL